MTIRDTIEDARKQGKLLDSAAENLAEWLVDGFLPDWARESLEELVEKGEFGELSDRFYQYIAFGTGGMRGRTIGGVSTSRELRDGKPLRAGVGSALLNDFNVIRATIGLYRYVERYLEEHRRFDIPRLVIAHDVRHFSRHFCRLSASVWSQLGGQAFVFSGPRSTPQLSFTVRYLNATAGAVITASHNPPHDNGFKVYFEDGAQVVEPHAGAIVQEVGKVDLRELPPYLDIHSQGIVELPEWVDKAYLDAASTSVLDPSVFEGSKMKAVFSMIHGTAGVQCMPLFRKFGVDVATVEEQMVEDPNFPTVKSPNPENAEALSMAMRLADEQDADVVLATDPDCDRVGMAVRNSEGQLELLTGNQTGALLAAYRLDKYKELGILSATAARPAALVKTFVTTELQAAIARKHGLKVIDTLTGFKWIGEKLRIWEEELLRRFREDTGIALDYDATDFHKRAELLQQYSTFYAFGGEESYGYLGNDTVRDKDGNTAVIMLCEMAAALKKRGLRVTDYLDELYQEHGYYQEALGQIYYEGAAGAAKIERILNSYRENPPAEMGGAKVTKFRDFGRDEIFDVDGHRIPAQNFYFLDLANGYTYAVRGSGTEPKIKFYLFAHEEVSSREELAAIKEKTRERLGALREAIETDAANRADG